MDTGAASVLVLKLSAGKQLHSYAAVSGAIGPESYQSVASLIVRRDGDVAWIVSVSSIVRDAKKAEVDRGSSLLDSGASIRPSSLRLHSAKLTWRDGNSVRSAKFS